MWEKIGPKEKIVAKDKTLNQNDKTLNPRRRALVKREKERGQESSLKQYKRRRREEYAYYGET
jgi:hypothetical protein